MDISGSHRIPAPRVAVWRGLNDPETLKSCIPGCESVEKTSDGGFRGVVGAKVGPMRATLSGDIVVSGGPENFTLTAKGGDDKVGGGEGSADVTLAEEQGETILTYAGRFEATGKILQLGARLLTGVARTGVETFLSRFSDTVAEAHQDGPAETARVADAPPLAPGEAAPESAAPVAVAEPETPPIAPPKLFEEAAPNAIAPTAAPDIVEPEAIAAEEAVEPSRGSVTRIMLVAAIAVAVAIGVYFFMLQPPAPPPPPA